MTLSDEELRAYGRACEHLLSTALEPVLTKEQKEYVIYYANEVLNKFDPTRQHSIRYRPGKK